MEIRTPDIPTALEPAAELDQLGDEIAQLSAHIEAATARLLDLIREFDARGGWNTGFLSCAGWLTWRGGLGPGAPRGRARGGRAPGAPPPPRRPPRTGRRRAPRAAPPPPRAPPRPS